MSYRKLSLKNLVLSSRRTTYRGSSSTGGGSGSCGGGGDDDSDSTNSVPASPSTTTTSVPASPSTNSVPPSPTLSSAFMAEDLKKKAEDEKFYEDYAKMEKEEAAWKLARREYSLSAVKYRKKERDNNPDFKYDRGDPIPDAPWEVEELAVEEEEMFDRFMSMKSKGKYWVKEKKKSKVIWRRTEHKLKKKLYDRRGIDLAPFNPDDVSDSCAEFLPQESDSDDSDF